MSGCSVNPLSWGSCATGAIGTVLGGAGKAVAGGVFDLIARAFGDAASAAVSWLWGQISAATAVDLTDTGIRNLLAITAVIAGIIALAMFCIQVIASALRQDFGGLGRAVRGMLVAFVGAAFAIATTQLLLAAVDDLAAGVVRAATGQNMAGVGRKLLVASTLGGLDSAGLFLFALVLLIAVVVIWSALMIRKMLIVVAAVFAPIAFSGATSDLTRGWVRRWIEFTVALICSKLILVLIFVIGLSMVNGARATGAATNKVTNLAIGALTLLLAGFAPWVAIKMVHFAGDAFGQVHAHATAASAGGAAVAAAPQKANALHSQAASLSAKLTPSGQAHNGVGQTSSGLGQAPSGSTRNAAGSPRPSSLAPMNPTQLNPTQPASGPGSSSSGASIAPAATATIEAARAPGHAANKVGDAVEQATPPIPPPRSRDGSATRPRPDAK